MNIELLTLNANYAAAIDDDRLEDWPSFFVEDCLYKVTTAKNYLKNMPAALIYADSRDMLSDRVLSLRKANVYERQRYRHIVGLPRILHTHEDGSLSAETPFVALRIVRDGGTDVFASGRYIDRVAVGKGGALFKERIVVCDSSHVDTLLALPL